MKQIYLAIILAVVVVSGCGGGVGVVFILDVVVVDVVVVVQQSTGVSKPNFFLQQPLPLSLPAPHTFQPRYSAFSLTQFVSLGE